MKHGQLFFRCMCILLAAAFLFNTALAETMNAEPVSTADFLIESETNETTEYESEPADAAASAAVPETAAPETQTPAATIEAEATIVPETTVDPETANESETTVDPEAVSVVNENMPELADGVYQIATADELMWFAALVNGTLSSAEWDGSANAVLTCDIDLAGRTWSPIGNPANPYAGDFGGAGHSVTGLAVHASDGYQALFGYLAGGAHVRDLNVYGGVETDGDYAAGVAAYSDGAITNVRSYCDIASEGKCVGGVQGGGSGSVSDCENYGTVRGYGYVGGVAGSAGVSPLY